MAFLKKLPLLLLAAALVVAPARGADPAPDPDASWGALKSAKALPDLPPEWEKTPPADQAQVRQVLRAETERLLGLAERARAFAVAYPSDPRRDSALQIAGQALTSAEKMGSPTARKQLGELDGLRLADPRLAPAERLKIRMRQVQAAAEALTQTSAAEARNKFEEGARELIRQFPKEPAPWAMLLECVDQGNDAATRAKLQEVAERAPDPVKERAGGILHRYDTLGNVMELKFTAIDGQEVDLAKLRGRVVLIHFWATWCTTCVEGMEPIAKAYDTLHELGVEVIGINVDAKREKVEQFLKDKAITWPQYYEPAGQGNRVVREWGVTALPTMWLVDRNGLLRELDAQPDLSKKIETMLSEPATAAR